MPEAVQLPKWQFHKSVWADKIMVIHNVGVADREGPEDSGERWILACGARISVTLSLKARVPPDVASGGGYYVLYADGYESWRPAKAFEEGYTRI